jgi:hypothetical protein
MIKFNEAIGELYPEFDVAASNRLSRWYFQDTKGVVYKSACALHLFTALNDRFGMFIDPKRSMARKRNYIITFLEEGSSVKEELEVISTVVEEENIEEVFVPVQEVEVEEAPSKDAPFVDWDWINALKSTQSDKLAFDKYAEHKFGITLNRGKKIKSMIEEFKKALEEA